MMRTMFSMVVAVVMAVVMVVMMTMKKDGVDDEGWEMMRMFFCSDDDAADKYHD